MKYAIYYLFIIEKAWGNMSEKIKTPGSGHQQNVKCHILGGAKLAHNCKGYIRVMDGSLSQDGIV